MRQVGSAPGQVTHGFVPKQSEPVVALMLIAITQHVTALATCRQVGILNIGGIVVAVGTVGTTNATKRGRADPRHAAAAGTCDSGDRDKSSFRRITTDHCRGGKLSAGVGGHISRTGPASCGQNLGFPELNTT
jgi:hypothetical protein